MFVWLMICLMTAGLATSAEAITHIQDNEQVAKVLDEDYIFVSVRGDFFTEKEELYTTLQAEYFLEELYKKYLDKLDAGEDPRILIKAGTHEIEEEPVVYDYRNSKGETSRITDVHRQWVDNDTFEFVLFVEGKRFFGPFMTLVHVQIHELEEGHFQFDADVYAYPVYSFYRFFMKNLNLIESYFEDHTDEFVIQARKFLQ